MRIVADYLQAITLVEPLSVPSVVPSDADDDQVVAAAIAAGAGLIVSGDRDLLALKTFNGIQILNAAEAMSWMTSSK